MKPTRLLVEQSARPAEVAAGRARGVSITSCHRPSPDSAGGPPPREACWGMVARSEPPHAPPPRPPPDPDDRRGGRRRRPWIANRTPGGEPTTRGGPARGRWCVSEPRGDAQ